MSEAIGNYSPPHHQDVGESLSLMMEQERTTYACSNYLGRSHGEGDDGDARSASSLRQESQAREVTPEDRARLVDWCYEIADRCRLDRESVAAAMNLADRFASEDGPEFQSRRTFLRDRGRYQLLVATALYVSVKLTEPSVLSSEDLGAASRGAYSKEDIERTERTMLRGLGWRLRGPTALRTGRRILELMSRHVQAQVRGASPGPEGGAWDFLREELEFQTEVAVRDCCLATQRPSTVAAAAILNAIEEVEDDAEYHRLRYSLMFVMEEFDFDPPGALSVTMERLMRLMEENENGDSDSVNVPDATLRPSPAVGGLTLEEIKDLCDKARERWVSHQLSPSSAHSMADTENDDDSCATLY